MLLRLATAAMGTRFELVLEGEDEPLLRAAGEAALEEIEDCDRCLSLFRRDSLLAHINRRAAFEEVRLDADCFELFATCDEVHRASGGAFDVTLAPLMKRLGLHEAQAGGGPADGPTGWEHVELNPERCTLRFHKPGMSIDLGAVGKGHALDLAAASLRTSGVERALLHGGTSSVIAIGAPPARAAWRVDVELPGAFPAPWRPRVELRDESLSISAQHGRTLPRPGAQASDENADARLGHVLDPRSGSCAQGVKLAAVLADSARTADAWSTALLVAGNGLPADLNALLISGDDKRPQISGSGLGRFGLATQTETHYFPLAEGTASPSA